MGLNLFWKFHANADITYQNGGPKQGIRKVATQKSSLYHIPISYLSFISGRVSLVGVSSVIKRSLASLRANCPCSI